MTIMIFGTIILVLVAGMAFYHYLQGFFSAMMSAVLAILAGVVAVSYHEQVAAAVFAGPMPNYAHATALVGLFAAVYVFARLLTDRIVPGNVRLPVLVDKIAAGAAGFIAGVYAAGILALAAQLLPVGPSVTGYSRYEIVNREVNGVRVTGKYQLQDLTVYDELKSDSMEPGQSSSLVPIPADDILLGTVSYLSNGGSLAGDRKLSDVHPSYPDELFGQRLGPAKGGDVAFDKPSLPPLSVMAAYQGKQFLSNPEDFELKIVRGGHAPVVNVSGDDVPLVVRVIMDAGSNGSYAFNMGSIRLVVAGKNYIPVGSVQRGEVMLMTRPDDILFTEGRKAIDLLFMVEGSALPPQEGTNKRILPAGAFIEARRGARASLAGFDISDSLPADSSRVGIIEKDKNTQR